MQRLLAQAVPSQHHASLALIIQSDREHSAELLDKIQAKIFVEMNDDLSIGVGIKPMTCAFQFFAKLAEIVNLSVEDYPKRLVFIVDRLPATRYVDDAEPSHPEADSILDVHTLVVGPAMD